MHTPKVCILLVVPKGTLMQTVSFFRDPSLTDSICCALGTSPNRIFPVELRAFGLSKTSSLNPLLANSFSHDFLVAADLLLEFHNNLLIPMALLFYLNAFTFFSKNQKWW